MTQKPLVISFYTEDTPYQFEAFSLMQSCQNLEIETDIDSVVSKKTWALNCAIKPFFIREKLLQHKRPVFWIDVDAVFLKKPDFQEMLSWDMGVREIKRTGHDRRFRYVSGSLFFNYTPRSIAFLEQWCAYCEEKLKSEEDPVCLDQTSLADLIENEPELSIYPMPIAFAKIFDLDAELIAQEDVIVEHHQVSRVYKNLFDG